MLVLDHDRAGGYWGAVYVFTAIKGLQVIIDGPVGCENLPVTVGAALHRRAAAARAADRGHRPRRGGTRPRRHRRRDEARARDARSRPAGVVVTGSIAEMIGGGVTPEGTNIQRFLPRTIDEDQWQSADRAHVLAVDGIRRRSKVPQRKPRQARRARSRASTSSARSTAPSTCRPTSPRSAGWSRASAPRSTWCSRSAATSPTCRGWSMPTSMSACTASSAACCARRWSGPICRRRSACTRRPSSCARSANCSGLDPEPFIEREKHTTIKPIWDLWRSVTQDFFGTASFAIVANETYARGVRHFLEDGDGPALHLRRARAWPAPRPTTRRSAALVREKPPLILFGSYNERMYLAEAGGRGAMLHPGLVPGRDHPPPHRHAVHGLCRRDLPRAGSLQRAVRRAVQHPAARHRPRPRRCDARAPATRELPWDDDAQALPRRDASKPSPCWCASRPPSACATRAERDARRAGEDRVTCAICAPDALAEDGRCAMGRARHELLASHPHARIGRSADDAMSQTLPRAGHCQFRLIFAACRCASTRDRPARRRAIAVRSAVAHRQVDLQRGSLVRAHGSGSDRVRRHGLHARASSVVRRADAADRCADVPAAWDVAVTAARLPQEACRMTDSTTGSLSGLTEGEAQEFHSIFMTSFIALHGDRRGRPHPRLDVASLAAWPEGLRRRSSGRRSQPRSQLHVVSRLREDRPCGEFGCCSIRAERWSPCSRSCSRWRC